MILVGMLFLLERFDYLSIGDVWRLWPLIFIVIGVLQLVRPEGRRSIFLLLLGIWFLVNTYELWGLDWADSWPVLIIFIGASFVFDSLVGGPRRPPEGIRVEVRAGNDATEGER
jgi:hypothetical protein